MKFVTICLALLLGATSVAYSQLTLHIDLNTQEFFLTGTATIDIGDADDPLVLMTTGGSTDWNRRFNGGQFLGGAATTFAITSDKGTTRPATSILAFNDNEVALQLSLAEAGLQTITGTGVRATYNGNPRNDDITQNLQNVIGGTLTEDFWENYPFATTIPTTSSGISDIMIVGVAIPEPRVYATLAGLAALGFIFFARAKRKKIEQKTRYI